MRVNRLADLRFNSATSGYPQHDNWAVPSGEPETQRRATSQIEKDRLPRTLDVIGPLEVRLTCHKHDVRRLQRLRYRVFFELGGAVADLTTRIMRRDKDPFDLICDHLMVLDHSARSMPIFRSRVIGTYRLLRQEMAAKHGGFYSAEEFDISSLLRRHPDLRFLELGRSCVLPAYRTKRAIELLWRGVWKYVQTHQVDVMIGCASFEGTDASRWARPLSFLHHFARAPEVWCTAAQPGRRFDMNQIPKHQINAKTAWHELPPLIKAYLRLGAFVGDGAAIDPKFGTTDVLIILPVSLISARYICHFGTDAKRSADQ